MPSTKVKARTTKYNATWWKSKRRFLRWEMVGMRPHMDIDDLVLSWNGGGKPLYVNGALMALTVARTIEGASTITMEILDPKGHLFSERADRTVTRPTNTTQKKNKSLTDEQGKPLNASELSGRAVEITLDDVVFRLTKVEGDLDDIYTLTFEDRTVYWLRRKRGALSASRASVTRAEFILKLVREIHIDNIPFICPQLSKAQPQAKPEEPEGRSLTVELLDSAFVDPPLPEVFNRPKFKPKNTDKSSPNETDSLWQKANLKDTGLTVKGKPATREQRTNMNDVLEQAWSEDGATARSVKSVVLGVIAESLVINTDEGTSTSKGILQLLASTAAAFHVDPMDIAGCVHLYMTKGFGSEGSAIALAKAHPDWPAYRITQGVQASGAGRASGGRANYGPWMDEAQRWMDAYHGKDTSLGGEGGGSYRKSYQYKRDPDENSWECGLRLADEVQWRLFPVGRSMVYSSELDLFRRKISEIIKKGDPRLLEFPWGMDWNKPVNECSIKVVLDSWSAYPGTVIMVDGYGAPDGRWLVVDMERDWFQNEATLTIKQPLTPLKEPAAEVGTVTQGVSGEGTKGDIGNLYQACQHIGAANKGYVWGGQHGVPFDRMDGGGGLDCSSSTSLALWRADLWDTKKNGNMAYPSWDFDKWGSPGSGHLFTVMYNRSHVWIQFEEAAGMMYKRFDTSAHGDGVSGDGPNMRKTERNDQASFQKRHWPGM